jgi:signal transduction histidine kinase
MLSLRRRLVMVSVLAALACGASLSSIALLARTSSDQRVARAEERVTRETERLLDLPTPPMRTRGMRRGLRALRSGYLDASGQERPADTFLPPVVREVRDAAVLECTRTGERAVRTLELKAPLLRRPAEAEDDDLGGTLVVAAAPWPGGGHVWVTSYVPQPRGERLWRIGAALLALTSLGLVAAAVHTVVALRRGAGTLDDGLRALSRDLGARVERPQVTELAAVADGITSLAAALQRSQVESARLQQELSQRERLASLGRVAAGVAHEVRNPMASIKLRVDLARQTVLSPRADLGAIAADLAEVSDEVSRLDRLVVDLLTVSGRRAGPKRVVELGELVAQRCAAAATVAAERSVRVEASGGCRATVDVDGLTRAIDNLLRNAVEASPEGASVRASVHAVGASARITVVDVGSGVPADRVNELFEPFFTTKPEGTGLGLALARAVAEAHGGALRYRRDGGATAFELTLPRQDG